MKYEERHNFYKIGRIDIYKKYQSEVEMMNKQHEVNAFCTGMIAGINLYQQKVITAQKNNEAIKIDGELYYIQSAKERLQDMVDKICK